MATIPHPDGFVNPSNTSDLLVTQTTTFRWGIMRELRDAGQKHTKKFRWQILNRYKGECFICRIQEWQKMAAHHMHRITKGRDGGRYDFDNTIPVCSKCHIAIEGMSREEIELLAGREVIE